MYLYIRKYLEEAMFFMGHLFAVDGEPHQNYAFIVYIYIYICIYVYIYIYVDTKTEVYQYIEYVCIYIYIHIDTCK